MIGIVLFLMMQTTNTDCQQKIIGMPEAGVTCTSTQAAQITPSNTQRPKDECARSDWFLIGCTKGMHKEAIAYKALLVDVGRSIAAKDCTGATNKALVVGDLDLAKRVKDLCPD